MRKIIIVLAFLFVGLIIQAQTTYYIDPVGSDASGNGTIGNPWKSLYKACAKIKTSGDIIHVNKGTYTETFQSNLAVGVNIEGDGVTSIIKSHVGSPNFTILLSSESAGTNGNQHISNIKMDGDALTGYGAIRVYNRNNVEIYNCTLVDFYFYGVSFDTYRLNNGVNTDPPVTYSTGNKIHDCTINNCSAYYPHGNKNGGEGKAAILTNSQDGLLIYNNILTQTSRAGGYNGFLIKGAGGPGGFVKNMKIYNNIITKADYDDQTWDFAIELWNVMGGCEIYNNTITGTIDLAGWYGVVKDGLSYGVKVYNNTIGISSRGLCGIYFEVYAEDAYIERNIISNVSCGVVFNITGSDLGPPTSMKNIYMRYNIFKIVSTQVIPGYYPSGYGVQINNDTNLVRNPIPSKNIVDNINIDNNVFNATSGGYQIYDGIEISDNLQSSNIRIRNNIIQGFPENAIVGHNGSINTLLIQNNIFYNNGSTIVYSGVTPSNYTNSNNLTGNPLFVSSSDFHLQNGSPAINSGLHISEHTTDLSGATVSNPPEIGAYEFIDKSTIK